jgi:aerobic-type carbon monoxide dehydrogenase small subunit (CoxS/CutS family)
MNIDDRIDAIFDRPADQGLSLAMVVMHRGEIVCERYGVEPANIFEPEKVITAESPLISWSVAKSMTHAVVGILAADGRLHPVQQAFLASSAYQCGYCTAGMIRATVGRLKTNPNPTRQELAHGVSGNLCRCQDYDKILTALMKGAEHMRKA